MSTYEEAEAFYGHPLQYAHCTGALVLNTEQMPDEQVRQKVGGTRWDRVERWNRCPTCEQWSPCDVRAAQEAEKLTPGEADR